MSGFKNEGESIPVDGKSIPIAYCINLDREPKKYKKVQKKFKDTIETVRISAIDGKLNGISGITALYKTNVNLFKQVINSDYHLPYLIVIEDDIRKHKNFEMYWPKILEFINHSGWDFISLDFLLNLERPKLEIYNDFLYRVEKSRMTGFMIYNVDFLRKNIDYLSSSGCLDMNMKHNLNFIQLIPKELIVKQKIDKFSNTANRVTTNYANFYKKTEKYLQEYRI